MAKPARPGGCLRPEPASTARVDALRGRDMPGGAGPSIHAGVGDRADRNRCRSREEKSAEWHERADCYRTRARRASTARVSRPRARLAAWSRHAGAMHRPWARDQLGATSTTPRATRSRFNERETPRHGAWPEVAASAFDRAAAAARHPRRSVALLLTTSKLFSVDSSATAEFSLERGTCGIPDQHRAAGPSAGCRPGRSRTPAASTPLAVERTLRDTHETTLHRRRGSCKRSAAGRVVCRPARREPRQSACARSERSQLYPFASRRRISRPSTKCRPRFRVRVSDTGRARSGDAQRGG